MKHPVQISTQSWGKKLYKCSGPLKCSVKTGYKFEQKEKDFCNQFYREFWKEFCNFL